jgi:outer membrane protein assembly factor BamB
MAFDMDTGEVVWKSLEENVSYSSPIVARIGGLDQVVAMTGPRLRGLDLKDGAPLWSQPFQIQYDESICTPVIEGDVVMVTASGRPLTAFRVTRKGEAWSAVATWKSYLLESYLSSAVAIDGHVYGMNDGGEFACLRVDDGSECWTGGRHGYYCSPVAISDVLLALNEKGELLALRRSPEQYEEIGVRRLVDEETWTSPAAANGRLYVRGKASLSCFELAP